MPFNLKVNPVMWRTDGFVREYYKQQTWRPNTTADVSGRNKPEKQPRGLQKLWRSCRDPTLRRENLTSDAVSQTVDKAGIILKSSKKIHKKNVPPTTCGRQGETWCWQYHSLGCSLSRKPVIVNKDGWIWKQGSPGGKMGLKQRFVLQEDNDF